MADFPKRLVHPLVIAGLLSWLAVVLLMDRTPVDLAFLGMSLVGFLMSSALDHRAWLTRVGYLLQGIAVIGLLTYGSKVTMVPVLQVVLTAQLAMSYPLVSAILAALTLSVIQYAIIAHRFDVKPLPMFLGYGGFQLFSMITAHYARSAEVATQRLALVNSDLLATRALLEHSARNGERLRVARDLHDVVGHKLTALRLNLHAIPKSQRTESLELADQLTGEILSDIRGVVSSLRDPDGLDMETALRAVAQAFPRPIMRLSIEPGLVIDDSSQAETLLRITQEAMTNAAKHGSATNLEVQLRRQGDSLLLDISDDGHMHDDPVEGNGLLGIRERLMALGGNVSYRRATQGGLHIEAILP